MTTPISSRRNPIVAPFRLLAEEPDPAGGRILLDGVHLVREAHESGAGLEIVAVAATRMGTDSEIGQLVQSLSRTGIEVVPVSDAVLDAMSPVRTPSGIVAIATRRPVVRADICATTDAFVLTVADVQDPGNVGALVRTAEAGGVTGVFASGASANPFSWKAVRGSMGSALRLPTLGGISTPEVLACLKDHAVRTVAAVTRGGDHPDDIDWRGRVSIVLGGEGPGLPDDIIKQCDAQVSIPMSSHVESLNVAAAGAILIYAARRQRNLKP